MTCPWSIDVIDMAHPILTAELCKAARAMLAMTQKELAAAANVGSQTVADFERGARAPMRNNLAAMQAALEAAGIDFITKDDEGVGLKRR